MKNIATKIHQLRRARGMSLSALARRARLNKGHLHGLENEKYVPGVMTLIRISEALNVDAKRLLFLSSVEILLHDDFLRQVAPLIRQLTPEQRERVLRVLAAAPRNGQ